MIFDPLYLLIIIGSLVLSGVVSFMVKSRFKAGSKVALYSNVSGYEVAKAILQDAGIHDVQIVQAQGFLSDHYNPLTKTLALSAQVYNGRNAAAAGVAAHEVGHAIQHSTNYAPMWMRSAIVPAANIGSSLGPWIIIAGIFLGAAQGAGLGYSLALLGVFLFGASTIFTLVTVPVEFDASSRAKKQLVHMGLVQQGPESDAVNGVLTAAGLTYVAAAVNSILMLLYWAFRAGLLGGDD
jgi:uncharacterized protein